VPSSSVTIKLTFIAPLDAGGIGQEYLDRAVMHLAQQMMRPYEGKYAIRRETEIWRNCRNCGEPLKATDGVVKDPVYCGPCADKLVAALPRLLDEAVKLLSRAGSAETPSAGEGDAKGAAPQDGQGNLSPKRAITIPRVNGVVPGLREVNAQLAKHNLVFTIELMTPESGAHVWTDCYLMPLDPDPEKMQCRIPITLHCGVCRKELPITRFADGSAITTWCQDCAPGKSHEAAAYVDDR
jgi:hypothetical protein